MIVGVLLAVILIGTYITWRWSKHTCVHAWQITVVRQGGPQRSLTIKRVCPRCDTTSVDTVAFVEAELEKTIPL